MKISIFISLIILFSISINSQSIIEGLDSPDYSVRLLALIEIRDNNLTEYSQDLLDRIFEQPMLFLSYNFLDVLYRLEYWDIVDQLYQFIDICDNFLQEQPLYHKAKATEILVGLDDFSTVEYVFEYINQDPLKNSEKFIELLKDIAVKIPQYSETVKDLLTNIKDNSEFYLNRRYALQYLIQLFGENTLKDEILYTIVNDLNSDMRKFGMEHYNFPDRKDLLKQQIQNDIDWFLRIKYTEYYLKNFTKPEDLKFIIDYLPFETDTNARNGIENRIDGFIPLKFENMNHIDWAKELSEDIDKLYEYSWINEPNYIYYKESLDYLLVLLEEENLDSCELLKEIKENAHSDYDSKGINLEAFAYIFYKARYIQETVPWSCD